MVTTVSTKEMTAIASLGSPKVERRPFPPTELNVSLLTKQLIPGEPIQLSLTVEKRGHNRILIYVVRDSGENLQVAEMSIDKYTSHQNVPAKDNWHSPESNRLVASLDLNDETSVDTCTAIFTLPTDPQVIKDLATNNRITLLVKATSLWHQPKDERVVIPLIEEVNPVLAAYINRCYLLIAESQLPMPVNSQLVHIFNSLNVSSVEKQRNTPASKQIDATINFDTDAQRRWVNNATELIKKAELAPSSAEAAAQQTENKPTEQVEPVKLEDQLTALIVDAMNAAIVKAKELQQTNKQSAKPEEKADDRTNNNKQDIYAQLMVTRERYKRNLPDPSPQFYERLTNSTLWQDWFTRLFDKHGRAQGVTLDPIYFSVSEITGTVFQEALQLALGNYFKVSVESNASLNYAYRETKQRFSLLTLTMLQPSERENLL